MDNQCYYCEQVFDSKEKLYDHLEVHSETEEKQKKSKKELKKKSAGESELSEEEIIEQFNRTKSGEPSRMSSN